MLASAPCCAVVAPRAMQPYVKDRLCRPVDAKQSR